MNNFTKDTELSKAGNNFGGRQLKALRDAVDEAVRQTDRAATDRLQWISDEDHRSLMALFFDLHSVLNEMEGAVRMAPLSDWIYEPTEHTKQRMQADKERHAA